MVYERTPETLSARPARDLEGVRLIRLKGTWKGGVSSFEKSCKILQKVMINFDQVLRNSHNRGSSLIL